MATLASASRLPDLEMPARASQPHVVTIMVPETAPQAELQARSVYQPSRKSGPLAFLASAGMIAAAVAALTTLTMVAKHQGRERLTVVEMKTLDTTPPSPPPETLTQPVATQPQVFTPQVFTPKPMITLPSPGPTQVALDLPPPPAPAVQLVAAVVEAPVAAAPAAPARSSAAVDGGDLSSQVISAKPPVYPIDARRAREQGTVKLLVLVGPDGRVSDVDIAGSSGSKRLDQAALNAVKRWRWSPTKRDGAAVAVRGYVTIPFVLV